MAASPSMAMPVPLLSLCFTNEDRRPQTGRQLPIEMVGCKEEPQRGAHGGKMAIQLALDRSLEFLLDARDLAL